MSTEVLQQNQDIIQQHIPEYEYAFGKQAVLATHERADNPYAVDSLESTYWRARSFIGTEVGSNFAQERLRALSKDQAGRFAEFIEQSNIPQSILDMNGVADVQSLVKKFRKIDFDDTSREQFMNFLQWHNHLLVERQSNFEHEKLPYYMQRFESNLEKAIQRGDELSNALDRFLQFKDGSRSLSIFMDDGLAAYVPGHNGNMNSYEDGSASIVLSVFGPDEEHTFTHEMIHALEGGISEDGTKVPTETARRGLNRLFGNGLGGISLNEAVTEHRADTLIYGEVDITNPARKEREHTLAYLSERYLLDTLCQQGTQKIDVRLFIKAATSHDLAAQESLANALEAAWPGIDLVQKIKNLNREENKEGWESIINFTVKLEHGFKTLRRAKKIGRLLHRSRKVEEKAIS